MFFVQGFEYRMDDLVFISTRTQTENLYTPKDLHDCEYIFLRNYAIKRPLYPTYSGPFQVVRKPKYLIAIGTL